MAVALAMLSACGGGREGSTGAPVVAGAPGIGQTPLGRPGGVTRSELAAGSQQELQSVAGDRVLFAYDRSDISPEGQQILQRQAEWLRRYANITVTIEGHADERGTREYNLALGERRAEAVKNLLIALGISGSRLSIVTYGKERPEVPHSDEQSYAQNRRAVTVIN